jgi:hypothetical protein
MAADPSPKAWGPTPSAGMTAEGCLGGVPAGGAA